MGASILLYVLSIGWGLVARVQAPWDPGGTFLECWGIYIYGVLLFHINSWNPGPVRLLLAHFVAVLSVMLAWGSTVYAAQMLLPLSLIGFGLIPLTTQSEDARNRLWLKPVGGVIVLVAVPWSAYALQRMFEFSKFLDIQSEQVERVQIGDKTWTETGDLMALCRALHSTTPYSPNHESIKSGQRATVIKKDGTAYSFQITRGNRTYPDTAWIQFGVEVYQNRELAQLLEQTRFKSSSP